MKVLMIGSHKSVKGGITTVINQLLDIGESSNMRVNYRFISTYYNVNLLMKIFLFLKSIVSVFFAIIFWKPRIIHFHMSYRGSYERKRIVVAIASFFKIPTVLHLHGSEFEMWFESSTLRKQEQIKKFLIKQNYVIVLGDEWKNKLKKISKDINTVVINNSVNIPRKSVSWNNERINILFLGVLIERKGLYDLIEAMDLLKKTQPDIIKNIRLTLAGTGPEEKKLKKIVEKKDLWPYIKFYGWVDNSSKEELILKHQIGILPSYNEGLPMTILELMSYGIPMITTPVGSIASVVKNNENGFLIDPGNIKELKNQIINLSNPKVWFKFSENSKLIIKEQFNEEKLLDKLVEIYKGEK